MTMAATVTKIATGKGGGEHANKFKQWLLEDNHVHYCENTVL